MDLLSKASYQQMNASFVESYLKMLHLLLNQPDPELEILAAKSFCKFAKIEEEGWYYW